MKLLNLISDILCYAMAVMCMIGATIGIGNSTGISLTLCALAVILSQIPVRTKMT